MMFLLLLAILGCLGVWSYWLFVAKPKRDIAKYAEEFKKDGYNVYVVPFRPFSITLSELVKEGTKRGDVLSLFKEDFQNYDVVLGQFLNKPFIKIIHPDLVKNFCQQESSWSYIKNISLLGFIQRIVGTPLSFCEGDAWKIKKKILTQIFNFRYISSQTNVAKNCCDAAFTRMENKDQIQDKKFQFDAKDLAIDIASNFIFQGFLGGNIKDEKINGIQIHKFLIKLTQHATQDMFDKVSGILGPKFINLGLRKRDRVFSKNMNLFNKWAENYIAMRKEEELVKMKELGEEYIPADIISVFASKNQNQDESYENFSLENLVCELKGVFSAGMETSASFLMASFHHIFKNEEVSQKLKEEIQEIFGNEEVNYQGLKNMKYLSTIQNEVLRLNGPGNGIFMRQAVCDHYLGNVRIYQGDLVDYRVIPNNYSEKYYAQAHKFRPERWLNGECDKISLYTSPAFHLGQRPCIGKSVALLLNKVIIIEFMKRYRDAQILAGNLQTEVKKIFWPKNYKIRVTKN